MSSPSQLSGGKRHYHKKMHGGEVEQTAGSPLEGGRKKRHHKKHHHRHMRGGASPAPLVGGAVEVAPPALAGGAVPTPALEGGAVPAAALEGGAVPAAALEGGAVATLEGGAGHRALAMWRMAIKEVMGARNYRIPHKGTAEYSRVRAVYDRMRR